MKYFSLSYWFKLWVLSAPLFNDKTQGINAKSIDNKNIKDWANNNTSDISLIENQELNLSNNQTSLLNLPSWNSNLTTHNEHHKHRHQKSRNRLKRQPNPNRRTILQLNEKLIIDRNNPNEYRTSSWQIVQSLQARTILLPVINVGDEENEDNIIFTLNTENYGYFRFPVEIRYEENEQSIQRNLELVFRTDNLYLQGFIIPRNIPHSGETYDYYHFDFSLVRTQYIPRPPRVPNLESIPGIDYSFTLTGIGPDYRDLLPSETNDINWETIFNSFIRVTNDINISQERPLGNLARALGQIIFATAESLRFRNIYNIIINDIINNNRAVSLRFRDNEIYRILINWGTESRSYNNLLFGSDGRYHGFEHWYGIDFIIHSYIGDSTYNFINNLTPIDAITEYLSHSNVRVLLSSILRLTFDRITSDCNRPKRELNNNYWHEKFCDLKPEVKNIQGKITVVNILDKDLKSNNLNKEDIFVGTTEGLYLIRENGIVLKADNIDNEITSIKEFGIGNFFVSTKEEKVYFLNTKRINNNYSLIAESLFNHNIESSDLNKEIKLYYNFQKDNWQMHLIPNSKNNWRNNEDKIINLKYINPIDNFEKLEFLGDVYSNGWGVKAKWGSWIYDGNPNTGHHPGDTYDLKYFMKNKDNRNNKFHDIIENKKGEISPSKENALQKFWDDDGLAHIDVNQRFGLTWYWENNNYYIKVFGKQYFEKWGSSASCDCWIKMGNGIRLYNDDTFETQIPNPNHRKRREIFEEKNITKWTDDFTKSINNEQHLSIHNKTNFVSSNITSL